MFAYASGTGQVPASVVISQNGTQIAYIENLPTGSSYFHVLTLGTTGTNGTSATAAVVPGSAGGNNAVDQRVLLSPDGGTTNQSSTNAVFVDYALASKCRLRHNLQHGREWLRLPLQDQQRIQRQRNPNDRLERLPSTPFRQLRYTIRYRIRSFLRIAAVVSIM